MKTRFRTMKISPDIKHHRWKPVISHGHLWREKHEYKTYISFYFRLPNYEEPTVEPNYENNSNKVVLGSGDFKRQMITHRISNSCMLIYAHRTELLTVLSSSVISSLDWGQQLGLWLHRWNHIPRQVEHWQWSDMSKVRLHRPSYLRHVTHEQCYSFKPNMWQE